MKLCSIIAVLALGSRSTAAYPTGAGSCLPGVPFGATSPHLTIAPQGEELSENGFEVFLNDEKLDSDSAFTVTTGKEYTLKLKGNAFKGFLVRIGENSAALTPASAGVQDAEFCTDGIAGVTHMDRNEKQEVSATLKVDDVGTDIPMDITVVLVLSPADNESLWYNTRFMINAEDPPTPAPSVSPSSAPSATFAPSFSPSTAPTPTSGGVGPFIQVVTLVSLGVASAVLLSMM